MIGDFRFSSFPQGDSLFMLVPLLAHGFEPYNRGIQKAIPLTYYYEGLDTIVT